MTRTPLSRTLAIVLTLALGACGSTGNAPHPSTPTARPVKRGPIDQAVDLLDAGKEKEAQRILSRLLKKNPNDGTAMLLASSIEKAPTDLLPGESYPYVVRQGDTLQTIAEHYLGSAFLFYALARYNHIAVPASVSIGQLLRVPSVALRPKPVPPPEPAAPKEAPKPEPKGKKKPAAAAAPAAPGVPTAAAPAPAPTANPALATRMRSAGLAALAGGNVDRAVALLARAASLDPANPLIQRDLGRAQRIQSTVRAKH